MMSLTHASLASRLQFVVSDNFSYKVFSNKRAIRESGWGLENSNNYG